MQLDARARAWLGCERNRKEMHAVQIGEGRILV